MDFQKAQLTLYKKIVNGGLYNYKGVNEVMSLVKTEGYLEYLHNNLIRELNSAINSLSKTKFDKVSVVMDSSKTSRQKLMNKFLTDFSNDNVLITVKDYTKVPADRIPYKYRLKINWVKDDVLISVYFENKYINNTTNIKIDFNLTKSREQALDVFEFIYKMLPKTKALSIFRDARITRLERYILLNDIPVWGVLSSRSVVVSGTYSYNARKVNNKIAAGYYISRGNSKQVAIYDKYASDSRIDNDDPDKYEFDENGNIRDAYIEDVSNIALVETKIETRNFKNKMNKELRKTSLFFCAPSTFPTYLRTVQFYSPLLLKELNAEQLKILISNGFYNFLISEGDSESKKVTDKYIQYKIEVKTKVKKAIEANFNVVFSSFLLDLSKSLGEDLFDPNKPLNKKYAAKNGVNKMHGRGEIENYEVN